jgi:hypothetical protein
MTVEAIEVDPYDWQPKDHERIPPRLITVVSRVAGYKSWAKYDAKKRQYH